MKKQTLELDWSIGNHSYWERELHRRVPPWEPCATRQALRERQKHADESYRQNPKRAFEIVSCEVCKEYLENAYLAGDNPFTKPAIVQSMLDENSKSSRARDIARIALSFARSSA